MRLETHRVKSNSGASRRPYVFGPALYTAFDGKILLGGSAFRCFCGYRFTIPLGSLRGRKRGRPWELFGVCEEATVRVALLEGATKFQCAIKRAWRDMGISGEGVRKFYNKL